MAKYDIEVKLCCTGMYSPWHLDIARKHGVSLMITSDIGQFVKINDNVYRLAHPRDTIKWKEYLMFLKEAAENNAITDEEFNHEIDAMVKGENEKFHLEETTPLYEFEERIKNMK